MTIYEKVARYLAKVWGEQVSCTDIHRRKDGFYVAIVKDRDGIEVSMLTPFGGQTTTAH